MNRQCHHRSFWAHLLCRALPEALLLVALGAVAGFAYNSARLDPLPVDLPANVLLTESGARVVFPGKARELFEQGEYVFVDARDEDSYVDGHVADAFSLPLERLAELYPLLLDWTGGQPLLVYGNAAEIVVADDLAAGLRDHGEKDVLLLAAGYEGWVARDYPVETGRAGVLDENEGAWPDDEWE